MLGNSRAQYLFPHFQQAKSPVEIRYIYLKKGIRIIITIHHSNSHIQRCSRISTKIRSTIGTTVSTLQKHCLYTL